jgi:iron complex transport system ATP-binding protein
VAKKEVIAMIECKGLSYRYGRLPALAEVDLKAGPGEMTGLLGPNGSGKSTLCLCLAGLLERAGQSGEIIIDGRNIGEYTARKLALQTAFVFQDNHFPFDFSALEIALMGRSPYLKGLEPESQKDLAAARKAMELCDCLELGERAVSSLSGGERQRVVLARALAQETPYLIMDEPTNHLDLRHQKQILGAVRNACHDNGLAAIVVLHDLNLAGQFCDRLVLLDKGRVASFGSPKEVLVQEILNRVYRTELNVIVHPVSGRPQIMI